MGFVTGLVVYSIMWFVVLFTVLPWGVRTQQEEGEVEPGTAESAPVNPAIWKKLLITTIVTALLFGIFYTIVEMDLFNFREMVSGQK
ncbi:DUF1467 family protein [Sneathiella sp. P13V-1]|uniref:DUF1467 family protein n=1 Tax=Sneathiella sp. P13V-1 TaxID=2697366 RepID=UPI00187BC0E7|nr:DUF1467 family protein [Sneathiella sp. P13V-1]MBE7637583.1 DUF1467 family protein [Sneathiella sp. P13V-1]